MSTTIGSKILHLGFDNAEFQQGVKGALKSISDLTAGLKLDGIGNSMKSLTDAARSTNLSSLADSVQDITNRFSLMGIVGVTALANIVNSAVNTGKQLVKSLTVDPVALGMADYDRKLTSIQTITNATGKGIVEVEGYFGQLDEYADKTIYNLDHMTGALAKFVNAGVDLDKAVPAIKGISNMTALAGQDANAAGIAYYNLSQSIAGGYLTTMDFKSLNLANVATKEWKQNMTDAAVAAGTIKEVVGPNGEKLYKLPAVKEAVTMQSLFNLQLSEGWATTDILLKVLSDYGDTTTEIGKKAQSAAQDVKSWGMMMETLKASVGTGWTDTFQLLIGDLDEAKALYTPLTETIQGILNLMTDTRNDLLQGWVDLGGRNDLIEGFKNAFYGLESILYPVREALRTIFPPLLPETLSKMTKAFVAFTKAMTIGDDLSGKLQTIFTGLFAVVDILRIGLSELWTELTVIVHDLQPYIDILLDYMVKVSELALVWRSSVQEYGLLQGVFAQIRSMFKTTQEVVLEFVNTINKAFSKFPEIKMETFYEFVEGLKTSCKPVTESMTVLDKAFHIIMTSIEIFFVAVRKLVPIALGIGDILIDGIVGVVDRMLDTVSAFDVNAILEFLNTAVLAGILLSIRTFLADMATTVGAVSETIVAVGAIGDKIAGILTSVRTTLEAYQQNLKADTLMKIAIAIGILAAAILVISLIDPDRLQASLMALAVMFLQLFAAMDAFMQLAATGPKVATLMGVVAAMTMLAGAILILSLAVAVLGNMDPEQLTRGVIAIGALSFILVATAKGLSQASPQMIAAAIGLAILGVALLILAEAVKSLASISLDGMIQGIGGLSVLLGVLILFMRSTSNGFALINVSTGLLILGSALYVMAQAIAVIAALDPGRAAVALGVLVALVSQVYAIDKLVKSPGKIIAVGYGLLVLAAAMRILAEAIAIIGVLEPDRIITATGAILVMLLGMIAVVKLIGTSGGSFIMGAASMIVMSVAIRILAESIIALGSMSWDEMIRGLVGVAGAMAILILAMRMITPNMGASALIMIGVSASLLILATAVRSLASLSWAEVGVGLTTLASVLLLVSAALYAMSGTAAGAAAMMVAALAISLFVPALKALGSLKPAELAMGLGALALGFGLFALAAYLLTPLLPTLVGLSVSIAGIGAGMILLGLGGAAIAYGITALSLSLVVFFSSVVGMIMSVLDIFPQLIRFIKELLIGLLDIIVDVAPVIGEAVVALLLAIKDMAIALIEVLVELIPPLVKAIMLFVVLLLDEIAKATPSIVDSILGFVIAILEGLADALPSIVQAGYDIVVAFLTGIRNNLAELINLVYDIATIFIDGVGQRLPEFIQTGFDFIIAFIDGLALAVEANMPRLMESVARLSSAIIVGLQGGIYAGFEVMWDTLVELGTNMIDAIKSALGIQSPSTEFKMVGQFIIDGLIEGLKNVWTNLTNIIRGFAREIWLTFMTVLPSILIFGMNLVQTLKSGIENTKQLVIDTIIYLGTTLVNTLANNISALYTTGRNLIQGLIDGINSLVSAAIQKAYDLGDLVIEAINDALNIESPSRKTYESGRYTVEGLVNGLYDYAYMVTKASAAIADAAIGEISTVKDKIANSLAGVVDFNPTITPVIDLSDVRKKSLQINDMFGAKSVAMAASVASDIRTTELQKTHTGSNSKDAQQTDGGKDSGTTFIQNVYSPKALDRYEVYRQTRLLLKGYKA
jgi:phage-related protein